MLVKLIGGTLFQSTSDCTNDVRTIRNHLAYYVLRVGAYLGVEVGVLLRPETRKLDVPRRTVGTPCARPAL